jgi:hypothetical protein
MDALPHAEGNGDDIIDIRAERADMKIIPYAGTLFHEYELSFLD